LNNTGVRKLNGRKKIFGLLLGAFLSFITPAVAETLEGRISAIDPVSQILTLVRGNSATGSIETLKLAVARNARFEGLASLNELSPGDVVRIEASKMEVAASWEANEIRKVGSAR
jgi:hypothetical protein